MIERAGGRLLVAAPMVMGNARAPLVAGGAVLEPGEQVFDLARVAEADSSAIAVMLGWLRAAGPARSTLLFANIPAGVLALAELYGINELLPRA
jgi:phospholipid transport system transporter-binding protein